MVFNLILIDSAWWQLVTLVLSVNVARHFYCHFIAKEIKIAWLCGELSIISVLGCGTIMGEFNFPCEGGVLWIYGYDGVGWQARRGNKYRVLAIDFQSTVLNHRRRPVGCWGLGAFQQDHFIHLTRGLNNSGAHTPEHPCNVNRDTWRELIKRRLPHIFNHRKTVPSCLIGSKWVSQQIGSNGFEFVNVAKHLNSHSS